MYCQLNRLEGTILNYHSSDDYCQCHDCGFNDPFSGCYPFHTIDFCDCVTEEFTDKRQSCFSRPTRKLPPLKPLEKQCKRKERKRKKKRKRKKRKDCIRNIKIKCDDGKKIVIKIKLN